MKNGLDSKAFAEELRRAGGDERRHLLGRFRAWVKRGARESQWWTLPAILLMGGAAFSALLIYEAKVPAVAYLACAVPVGIGVMLFRQGASRERAWREKNPFNTYRMSSDDGEAH